MKLYQLHAKQALPITKKEAWDFLSNPKNLKVITPDKTVWDDSAEEVILGRSCLIVRGSIW